MRGTRKKPRREQRLTAEVIGNRIVISIGINTAAWATNEHPDFYTYDEKVRDWTHKIQVTDIRAFAKEIVRAMLNEREDGSTITTDFMDKAILDAVEDGAVGVEFLKEPKK